MSSVNIRETKLIKILRKTKPGRWFLQFTKKMLVDAPGKIALIGIINRDVINQNIINDKKISIEEKKIPNIICKLINEV